MNDSEKIILNLINKELNCLFESLNLTFKNENAQLIIRDLNNLILKIGREIDDLKEKLNKLSSKEN